MDFHDRRLLAPFRRRTVRVGIRATLLILVGLVAVPFLPGGVVTNTGAYWALLAVTAVGGAVVWSLPWDRLLETWLGEVLLYAWSLLDIALITGLVAVTGGARSSFVLVYALTTIFFAASYPRRGQYGLFVLTSLAYLGAVAWSQEGGLIVADAVVVITTLGVAAYMTSFISGELLAQVRAHTRAREEADKRADQLARALDHLEDFDRLKSDFIANISHELRTPLTIVSGLSQTLSGRWEDLSDEQRRDFAEQIHRNAGALEDIVGTLLDFSNLQQGRLEAERSAIDLVALARGVVGKLRSLSAGHSVHVEADGPLPVDGDAGLLSRVLENLVTNAIIHTPAGTTVEVRVVEDGGEVVTAVHDDGPGIEEEVQAHLGERFFRGGETDTRSTRGLGLGLAISAEILELHGSVLEVDSAPGEGSTFSFRLPRAEISPAEPASAQGRPGGDTRPSAAAGI